MKYLFSTTKLRTSSKLEAFYTFILKGAKSIPVRHPVHLRYPVSAGRPPPKVPTPTPPYTTATSFASIRLDQGLVIYRNYDIYSPIRIRAVPGTQQNY